MSIKGRAKSPTLSSSPIHRSPWKVPYSISYVYSPSEHDLTGRIETRKAHKAALNRTSAPEIEPIQAAQS